MKLEVKEKENKKWAEPYEIAIGVVMLMVLLYAIITILNFEVLAEKQHIVRNAQTKNKIYSLKSTNETAGKFYLGYGNFRGYDYYVYMQKDEKFGGFTKEKVPVSETLIKESNTEPNIVMNYCIVEDIEKRPFFSKEYKSSDSLEYTSFTKIPANIKYKYVITVPEGTVTERLSFDPIN